jgi:hypothetical protein
MPSRGPQLDYFGRAELAVHLLYLILAWVAIPLWGVSTWRHRKSLYVRVRQPLWLLADLALALVLVTLISLKEVLLVFHKDLPCALTNGAAAVGMVWVPGIVLCRSLQLWYGFTLMHMGEGRVDRLRRFRMLLFGCLISLAAAAAVVATWSKRLCISDM